MAKTLSKAGILTGADILAGHVTQSVDALTGIEAYDITISGSTTISGSLNITPTQASSGINVLTVDSTGKIFKTGSYSAGGGGPTPNLQEVTDQGNTTTNDIKITGSLYQSGSLAYFQPDEFAVDALGDTVLSVGQSNTQNVKIGISTTSTEVRSPLTASIISASGDIQALSFTGVAGTTNNLTSSYAITASHALNGGGGGATFPFTGSALITGSLGVTGSISNTQGNNKITLIDGVIDISTPTNHLYIGAGGELTQSYSSGQDNVAIGLRAGFTTIPDPGTKNTFIGNTAGQYNTNTPQANVGIGHSALSNIQGDNNIGIGVSGVLGNGVSGGNNIGIGRASLYGIASGEHNISIGDGIAAFSGMDYQLKIGDGSIIAISASLTTGDIIFPSTASSDYFVGDGSQLTNLPASSVSTASYTSIWSLGAVSSDHYTFTGPGLTGAENDPDIYLTRGEVYKFNNDNSSGAHPFQIQTIGGSAYNDGVTNNGGAGGTSIEIDVQFDAPTKLFYQCTSHAPMRGIIYIADAINHSGSFSGSFQGDGSQLTNLPGGGGSVGTLQQVTNSGSVTTNAITSSGLFLNNGTNISPNNFGVGQLKIAGAGYTSYIAMDSSSAYLGHNSLVRDFSFQTNEITRLTLLQNGNISASGDIQALSFTGVAGTTNNLTSSYAITASHALNITPAFPFTGDAQITGSILISGSNPSIEFDNTIIIGSGSGENITTGVNNILIGDSAGNNLSTTSNNVIIGKYAAGGQSAGGSSNVYVGYEAGFNGNNASYNVGVGYQSLKGLSDSNGYYNVALGYRAGLDVNSGIGNVLLGYNAGYNVSSGDYNTLVGYQNAYTLSTGNYNTFLGTNSGGDVTGDNNIIIGYKQGNSLTNGDNNIFIGSGSDGASGMENQLQIGISPIVTISASLATGDIIFASTASADYFVGDGSQLSNLPAPFPFTGDAQITGSLLISSSTSESLSIQGSGSTIFNVQGSQGQLFSVTDDLLDEVFSVSDISGDALLTVSGSGLVEIPVGDLSGSATATASYGAFKGDGSQILNLQRPISNSVSINFTASNLNSGYYFRVGGNITCSIQTNAVVPCDIGSEFDFFQTSSAGNFLFLSGSGVTLNTKGGFTKLDGQFAGATLKKIDTNEWDLVGDLNS